MRITAGRLKGLEFYDMHGARAHPMSDRIKNALFNTLGDIVGLSALDAFGGSGALAFEAISRGADSATICEIDKKASKYITDSIIKLELKSQVSLVNRSVYSFINETSKKYDIVLVDPPFDEFDRLNTDLFTKIMNRGAVMVISLPSERLVPDVKALTLVKQTRYGNASLAFYKKA